MMVLSSISWDDFQAKWLSSTLVSFFLSAIACCLQTSAPLWCMLGSHFVAPCHSIIGRNCWSYFDKCQPDKKSAQSSKPFTTRHVPVYILTKPVTSLQCMRLMSPLGHLRRDFLCQSSLYCSVAGHGSIRPRLHDKRKDAKHHRKCESFHPSLRQSLCTSGTAQLLSNSFSG